MVDIPTSRVAFVVAPERAIGAVAVGASRAGQQ
jgi:hypothetical protein